MSLNKLTQHNPDHSKWMKISCGSIKTDEIETYQTITCKNIVCSQDITVNNQPLSTIISTVQGGGGGGGVTPAQLTAEETARTAADTTLQTNIDTLNTVTGAALGSLGTQITTEETARTAADTTLQTNIDNVATSLGQSVLNEANLRANNDTTLQTNIDNVATSLGQSVLNEANLRANNDVTLQTNINANATAITTLDGKAVKYNNFGEIVLVTPNIPSGVDGFLKTASNGEIYRSLTAGVQINDASTTSTTTTYSGSKISTDINSVSNTLATLDGQVLKKDISGNLPNGGFYLGNTYRNLTNTGGIRLSDGPNSQFQMFSTNYQDTVANGIATFRTDGTLEKNQNATIASDGTLDCDRVFSKRYITIGNVGDEKDCAIDFKDNINLGAVAYGGFEVKGSDGVKRCSVGSLKENPAQIGITSFNNVDSVVLSTNSTPSLTVATDGTVQLNKTPYQGTSDAITTLSSTGVLQKTGSTCDASGNLTAVKMRSNQYYDGTGSSGFFMGVGAGGSIQMNKSPYQGTADALMTLSANGTIQKTTSTCDASGNLTALKMRSNQYYDGTGSSGFFMGVGAGGSIQMNKTPYQGVEDAVMTLSGNGTIKKSSVIADASGVMTALKAVLNDKAQSNKYYNLGSTAGIDIVDTTVGSVTLSGSQYQNKNNSLVTLDGTGQIRQPSTNATVDAQGNMVCKNLELLNINNGGEIKAKTIQSNDAANPLSLLNKATTAGKGLILDATTNGNIQLTGDSYVGTSNAMVRLNTNGTLEKTAVTIDGTANDNISNVTTLSCQTGVLNNAIVSSNVITPNMILGTFGGGPATAGTMDLNSGNVTNTGDITPVTDNTEDIGSLALSYKNIHIKGDVFKNGVAIGGGGGGSITGISSVDNGANDIEISFTGSDYLQQGYLSIDANGRIQVVPSIQLSNAEYDAIVAKWNVERTNQAETLIKLYLPAGVTPGTFNHTIHFCYILSRSGTGKTLYEVRFIGYQGSTAIQETSLTNNLVANALEIYNLTSTAHPNQVQNPNEKQHIINHYISDYQYETGLTVTSVVQIAVLTGDVGNWDHTKPFWVDYRLGTAIYRAVITLYGSQSGYKLTSAFDLPSGYTLI